MRPSTFTTAAIALTGRSLANPISTPTNTAELSRAAISAFKAVPSSVREDIAHSILRSIPPEALTDIVQNEDGSYPTSALISMATSALQTISTGVLHAHIEPHTSTTEVDLSIALPSTTITTETVPLDLLQELHPGDNDDLYVSGSAVLSGAYKTAEASRPMDVQGGGWWDGIVASSTSTSTVTLVSTTASVAAEASLPVRPVIKTTPRPVSSTDGWQRKTMSHSSTSANSEDGQRGTISHSSKMVSSTGR